MILWECHETTPLNSLRLNVRCIRYASHVIQICMLCSQTSNAVVQHGTMNLQPESELLFLR